MELNAGPALIVIYRWRIGADHIDAFRSRWAAATRELAPFGSLGSLLAQAEDGVYHAIALWPDRTTKDAAFARTFSEAAWPPAEALEPIILDTIDNLWRPQEKGGPVGPPS